MELEVLKSEILTSHDPDTWHIIEQSGKFYFFSRVAPLFYEISSDACQVISLLKDKPVSMKEIPREVSVEVLSEFREVVQDLKDLNETRNGLTDDCKTSMCLDGNSDVLKISGVFLGFSTAEQAKEFIDKKGSFKNIVSDFGNKQSRYITVIISKPAGIGIDNLRDMVKMLTGIFDKLNLSMVLLINDINMCNQLAIDFPDYKILPERKISINTFQGSAANDLFQAWEVPKLLLEGTEKYDQIQKVLKSRDIKNVEFDYSQIQSDEGVKNIVGLFEKVSTMYIEKLEKKNRLEFNVVNFTNQLRALGDKYILKHSSGSARNLWIDNDLKIYPCKPANDNYIGNMGSGLEGEAFKNFKDKVELGTSECASCWCKNICNLRQDMSLRMQYNANYLCELNRGLNKILVHAYTQIFQVMPGFLGKKDFNDIQIIENEEFSVYQIN